MEKRHNFKKIFLNSFFILILLVYIVSISYVSFQNDTLFDIVLGKKYVTEGISTVDNFSIHENLEYISHHFMVNIITYFVHLYYDFTGLYILEILLTILLGYLLYTLNKKFVKCKKIAYAFVFIELAMLNGFISIRAQMYSYILFALELILIENFLKKKKIINLIILTIIPFLIINFHAGVIYFYYILIGVYLINYIPIKLSKFENERKYVKNLKYLLIPFTLSIPLLFINPFGVKCLSYAFKTLNNTFINTYIAEFQQTTLLSYNGNILFIALFIIFISFICTKKKIKIHHFLLFIGTAFMTLITTRHLSLFIICAIPAQLPYIEDMVFKIRDKLYFGVIEKGKKVLKYTTYIMFFIVILSYGIYVALAKSYKFFPEKDYPIEAINYIKENIPKEKRIFNSYEYGSLLMYNDIKVFMDSRADLYTKEYSNTNIAIDFINACNCTENYDEILKKYNIDYLLLDNTIPLAKNISSNPDYVKVYDNNYTSIYLLKE